MASLSRSELPLTVPGPSTISTVTVTASALPEPPIFGQVSNVSSTLEAFLRPIFRAGRMIPVCLSVAPILKYPAQAYIVLPTGL